MVNEPGANRETPATDSVACARDDLPLVCELQNGRVDFDEFINIYNELVTWAASLRKAEEASVKKESVSNLGASAMKAYHEKPTEVTLSEGETELLCDIMNFGGVCPIPSPSSRPLFPSGPSPPRHWCQMPIFQAF